MCGQAAVTCQQMIRCCTASRPLEVLLQLQLRSAHDTMEQVPLTSICPSQSEVPSLSSMLLLKVGGSANSIMQAWCLSPRRSCGPQSSAQASSSLADLHCLWQSINICGITHKKEVNQSSGATLSFVVCCEGSGSGDS